MYSVHIYGYWGEVLIWHMSFIALVLYELFYANFIIIKHKWLKAAFCIIYPFYLLYSLLFG